MELNIMQLIADCVRDGVILHMEYVVKNNGNSDYETLKRLIDTKTKSIQVEVSNKILENHNNIQSLQLKPS